MVEVTLLTFEQLFAATYVEVSLLQLIYTFFYITNALWASAQFRQITQVNMNFESEFCTSDFDYLYLIKERKNLFI